MSYLGKAEKVKVLSTRLNKSRGYCYVNFCKDGKTKSFSVHRLVFSAFNGPIAPGMTVDHINGIKTDNRLQNLQLLTREDNTRKAKNKQLDLMLAEWPYSELTFSNSREASRFFRYKDKTSVGAIIHHAKKRGENFISLRKKKYFFAQAN